MSDPEHDRISNPAMSDALLQAARNHCSVSQQFVNAKPRAMAKDKKAISIGKNEQLISQMGFRVTPFRAMLVNLAKCLQNSGTDAGTKS